MKWRVGLVIAAINFADSVRGAAEGKILLFPNEGGQPETGIQDAAPVAADGYN